MKKRSIVLLSGGLDSAYSFVVANNDTEIVYGLSYDYGQNSAKKEIEAAKKICNKYNVRHKIINLPFFKELTEHPLLNEKELPTLDIKDLDNKEKTTESASAVWIPNRNGIFLNIAAGLAEMTEVDYLYTGFNAEEAGTFSDNTQDFVRAINQSFAFSTLKNIFVKSPPIELNKKEIVAKMIELEFDFNLLWSCYKGGQKMCGKCESCLRLKRALTNNEVTNENLFA